MQVLLKHTVFQQASTRPVYTFVHAVIIIISLQESDWSLEEEGRVGAFNS